MNISIFFIFFFFLKSVKKITSYSHGEYNHTKKQLSYQRHLNVCLVMKLGTLESGPEFLKINNIKQTIGSYNFMGLFLASSFVSIGEISFKFMLFEI